MFTGVFRDMKKNLCIVTPTPCSLTFEYSFKMMNFKITKVDIVNLKSGEDPMHDVRVDLTVEPVGDSTFNTNQTSEDMYAMINYFKGGLMEQEAARPEGGWKE